MDNAVLFADISPMEELLDSDFADCTSKWIESHCLEELVSEEDDVEDPLLQLRLNFESSNESAMSGELHIPQSLQDSSKKISDDQLMKLSIRDLNQRLKGLPKAEAQKVKKRRRGLKNRVYATTCRQRRTTLKESLQTENQRLKGQLRDAKENLCNAVKDRDFYKKKLDHLNKVYLQH